MLCVGGGLQHSLHPSGYTNGWQCKLDFAANCVGGFSSLGGKLWKAALVLSLPFAILDGGPQNGGQQPGTERSRLGLAVQSSGHVCLSIRNARLAPGTKISLVSPSEPQEVSRAEVLDAHSKPCSRMADRSEFNYSLRVVTGTVENNLPLIAVVDDSISFKRRGRTVTANLDKGKEPVSFRSCTSSEGVHLTVWRGQPLKGVRLWHQYYYLGQDVEPTCTDQDTAN